MNEKKFCPKCGHEFEQGEYNYNYDSALLDYTCPECGWEGTEEYVIDIDRASMDLHDEQDRYELEGVELTEEDSERVLLLYANGTDYDDAIAEVLSGIRECLDEGLDRYEQ